MWKGKRERHVNNFQNVISMVREIVMGSLGYRFSGWKPLWPVAPLPQFCLGLLGSFCPLSLAGCAQLTLLAWIPCLPRASQAWNGEGCVSERGVWPLQTDIPAATVGWAALGASMGAGSLQGCSQTGTGEHGGAWKLGDTRDHRAPKRESQPWCGELLGLGSRKGHSSPLLLLSPTVW